LAPALALAFAFYSLSLTFFPLFLERLFQFFSFKDLVFILRRFDACQSFRYFQRQFNVLVKLLIVKI
jgi:hypothetical protein